jgi:type III pantothenate kinase
MCYRLFNIGNTHAVSADVREDGSFTGIRSVPTEEFHPEEFLIPGSGVVSVVPRFDEAFRNAGAFVLDWRSCNPVISLEKMLTPETIGADRIANAVSLASTGKLPAVCIDCGTAITFEYVDQNRCLCGGAILPGRKLLRKALHDYTAKLPLVPFPDQVPEFPGRNTVEAIQIGTDSGAVGAVREILEQLRAKEPELRVVLCGGDAPFFHPYFPEAECYGSEFTLKGLAYAMNVCRRKND